MVLDPGFLVEPPRLGLVDAGLPDHDGEGPGIDLQLLERPDDASGLDIGLRVVGDVLRHDQSLQAGLGEDHPGQAVALLLRRVPAELRVVGGPAAGGHDGVEDQEAASSPAAHEPDVPLVHLGVAGCAPVRVDLVHLDRRPLPLGQGVPGSLLSGLYPAPQVRLAVQGGVVHRHHCRHRHDLAVDRLDQRVGFEEVGVVLGKRLVQPLGQGGGLQQRSTRESRHRPNLPRLELPQPLQGIDLHPVHLLGVEPGQLLDLHPAEGGDDDHRAAAGRVDGEREVHLPGHVDLLRHQHPLHGVVAHLHPEELLGPGAGLGRRGGELHRPRLAPLPRRHQRFQDHFLLEHRGGGLGLAGVCRHRVGWHGDPQFAQKLQGLVFQEPGHITSLPAHRAPPATAAPAGRRIGSQGAPSAWAAPRSAPRRRGPPGRGPAR